MISEDRLKLIERELQKNPNDIIKLTDAELISYQTYLKEKIKDKKVVFYEKRNYCQNLLSKIKNEIST